MSSSTKAAVIERYDVDESRIVVIHQGASDAFRPVDDPAALREVRTRYFGADRPYLLFVGKCSARRNIPMLVRAFARLHGGEMTVESAMGEGTTVTVRLPVLTQDTQAATPLRRQG